MDNNLDISHEELEKMLEKAKRDLQERLEKMTPEERAEAERKAKIAIEEDNARIQNLLDTAKKYASESPTRARPNFCTNCGAPAGDGNFCEYCGKPF